MFNKKINLIKFKEIKFNSMKIVIKVFIYNILKLNNLFY